MKSDCQLQVNGYTSRKGNSSILMLATLLNGQMNFWPVNTFCVSRVDSILEGLYHIYLAIGQGFPFSRMPTNN